MTQEAMQEDADDDERGEEASDMVFRLPKCGKTVATMKAEFDENGKGHAEGGCWPRA